jgi:hypothetical protein
MYTKSQPILNPNLDPTRRDPRESRKVNV